MLKKVLVSIIIPVKEITDYLREETIPAILKQTHQNFEIIILPDKKSKEKFKKRELFPVGQKLDRLINEIWAPKKPKEKS